MANTKITTAVITADAITGALIADDVSLGGNPTTSTQSAGNDTTRIATTAFVTTAIDNLVDSAPGTMNTLNEIAAALNDDANFNTTVTNLIASKAAISGQTFSGDIQATGVYVGSTNTSYDFYNNGTSYFNGAVTVDDNLTSDKYIMTGGSQIGQDYAYLKGNSTSNASLTLRKDASGADAIDFLQLRNDANTLIGKITGPGVAHFTGGVITGTLSVSGVTTLSDHISIPATKRLYLDGSGDTFIEESSANTMSFVTGNTQRIEIDSAGTVSASTAFRVTTDGSASSPNYQVGGDADTGMYQPAVNQLGFTVAGSRKMYFSTTTAYLQNLTGGLIVNGIAKLENLSNYTGLEVKGSGASRPSVKFTNVNQGVLGQIYGTEGNALVIATGTSSNTAITIDSSQQVGIGTGTGIDGQFHAETSVAGRWTGVFENTGGQGSGILIKAAGDGGANPLLDIRNGTETVFTIMNSNGVVTATNSAKISQASLTSSSNAVAWDAARAANAYHVTTENTTFSAPSNAVEGAIISVEIAQGGTARTIGWNTVFEFAASTAPTMTATANKTDIYTFRYNGSVWQEIGRVQNMAQT